MNEAEKTRLVNNIAGHLKDAKEFLQKRAVSILTYVVEVNTQICQMTTVVNQSQLIARS